MSLIKTISTGSIESLRLESQGIDGRNHHGHGFRAGYVTCQGDPLPERGLPHAHCIFVLDQASKNILRDPARVDTIISVGYSEHDQQVTGVPGLQY